MAKTAELITPDRKTIELPPDLYFQVKELLNTRQQHQTARSRVRMKAAIQAGYGMAAGSDSLTAALLEERSKERPHQNATLTGLDEVCPS
ncbi:MAG: hypothetical protein H8D34_26260 [Chloroflexi bacterium]|nr:hypothetical protein [Chloroflexota bacterium]